MAYEEPTQGRYALPQFPQISQACASIFSMIVCLEYESLWNVQHLAKKETLLRF